MNHAMLAVTGWRPPSGSVLRQPLPIDASLRLWPLDAPADAERTRHARGEGRARAAEDGACRSPVAARVAVDRRPPDRRLLDPLTPGESRPPSSNMPPPIFDALVAMWTDVFCAEYLARHPELAARASALDRSLAATLAVQPAAQPGDRCVRRDRRRCSIRAAGADPITDRDGPGSRRR
jgi:hypothetical protein